MNYSVHSIEDVSKTMSKSSLIFLYYNSYTYHSQKIYLTLLFHNLKFKRQYINIGENYKPWFMKISPKGVLPAFRHAGRVFSKTIPIVQYIDKNLASEYKLIPSSEESIIIRYMELIDTVDISLLRFHTLLTDSYKSTKIANYIAKKEIDFFANREAILYKLADKHSDLRSEYLSIISAYNQIEEKIRSPNKMEIVTANLESILNEIEKELFLNHKANNGGAFEKSDRIQLLPTLSATERVWLCTDEISAADIWLGVLLCQLDGLGLSHNYWRDEKLRPQIASYFANLKNNDFFKSVIPNYRWYSPITYQLSSHPYFYTTTFLVIITSAIFYFDKKQILSNILKNWKSK